MPLCYNLDNRDEDMFIGMRDIDEVLRGVQKYNRTPFHIDESLVKALLTKKRNPFSRFSGKSFTVVDKIIDANLVNFTLVKISLI